jgi:acetyltransferase-like isoleucine patch superfamily enzyme
MAKLFNEILRHLPDRYGNDVRRAWLARNCSQFGEGSIVARGCRVLGPEQLGLGRGVIVARDVTLDARGGLELGDEALIGFESVLLTETHRSDQMGVAVQHQGMWRARVSVGERAWIGMRVLVLPGITIGSDAIVGAGSLVTKDVPDGAIAAGVPARVLRSRA